MNIHKGKCTTRIVCSLNELFICIKVLDRLHHGNYLVAYFIYLALNLLVR